VTALFSVLRYRPDSATNEGRSIAVALVDDAASFAMMKAAPPSTLSATLRGQALLDDLLVSLARTLAERASNAGSLLGIWHEALDQAVSVSQPDIAAVVGGHEATLDALYRVFVAPKRMAIGHKSRWAILDQVITSMRSWGASVHRGYYLNDFMFDAVVDPAPPSRRIPSAIQVISFANQHHDWSQAERAAGHYLFAREHVDADAIAVIQPPEPTSPSAAHDSHGRVLRWMSSEQVTVVEPRGFLDFADRFKGTQQLALRM
jgi:hypothetical protein